MMRSRGRTTKSVGCSTATSDVLLDTHSLIWVLQGGTRFGAETRELLQTSEGVRFSSISIAEIRIKQMLGKLAVPEDVLERIEASGLQPSSFTPSAADELLAWPQLVRHDPFDRLLLAQAASLGTRLLTVDRVLLELEGAPVLDARR